MMLKDSKTSKARWTTWEGTRGFDVSHYQPHVDWQKAKAQGFRFAYIKATEGKDWIDPLFARHWRAAGAFGFKRGAYHFFRGNAPSGWQAEHFTRTLRAEGGGFGELPLALDVEVADGLKPESMLTEVLATLQWIEKFAEGARVIVYAGWGFWNDHLPRSPLWKHYGLWVANYTSRAAPVLPADWTEWEFWQRTERGAIPGVEGGGDLDFAHTLNFEKV